MMVTARRKIDVIEGYLIIFKIYLHNESYFVGFENICGMYRVEYSGSDLK